MGCLTDLAGLPGAMAWQDPNSIDVIAPNFKRRLSGVTSTIVRLLPLQAQDMAIAGVAPALPDHLPLIRMSALLTMARRGPTGPRIWHARRNTEMLGGLALKYLLGKDLRLLFTSASQRKHTGYSRWLISKMDRVVATSAKGASYLEHPADVVLHGIDADSFTPPDDRAAAQAALGLPSGPIVGCFGRIRAQKGTDVFVDAMISAMRDQPGAAIIMGRTTAKHRDFATGLQNRIAAAGLSERILFLPEAPVDEMARWYQALDLFIAPQRWEGFGLTPLEAMACGVPTIATRVGAFEELIAPDQTGMLIPPGDTGAMAAAATRYLADAELRSQHGHAARAHIEDNFRIEGEAAALNAIYREMLAT